MVCGFPSDNQTKEEPLQLWGQSGKVKDDIEFIDNVWKVDKELKKKKNEKMRLMSKKEVK